MARTLIPGFRFSEGRLLVFTEEEVKIIRTWPDLTAVRKLAAERGWKPFDPCFRLLRPRSKGEAPGHIDALGPTSLRSTALDPEWEKQAAFTNFRQAIPAHVAVAVEGFPSRQWAVLAMCRRRARATELLEQNAAIGFAVAHNHKFRQTSEESLETAARLLVRRQREIIAWLGFPASQAWVNILSKIPVQVVTLERLQVLRETARQEGVEKLLSHLPLINAGVLAVSGSASLRALAAPSLLSEIAASPAEMTTSEVAHLLQDIAQLQSQMQICPLLPFRSIEEVRKRQQELIEEFEQLSKGQQENQRLPSPPLPGTADIVPLAHESQLQEEGRMQHNCVGTYVGWVQQGEGYIYRVLAPERATLAVVKGPDGCWEVQQLSLSCNRRVSDATQRAVESWLRQFSLSA